MATTVRRRSTRFGLLLLTVGALALGGCYVQPAASGTVSAGVPAPAATGYVGVNAGMPATMNVNSYPPEPLFENVSASPGPGYVWLDGSWHWNGYEWVWVGGRWVRERVGFAYVQPYYDYLDGRYVYVRGYWSHRSRLPRDPRSR